MWKDLVIFLAEAVVISLSGVLAPGPVTAATLAAGTRSRHAGALVAIGHGVMEFPLMFLILAGVGAVFQIAAVRIGVGLAGGAMLLLMGAQMLGGVGKAPQAEAQPPRRGPLVTGIVLTGGNPYFLIWWATVGLALATRAVELGILAFALFAAVHWLCDFVWLEALSLAAFGGSKLLGDRAQRVVLLVCGTALVVFGVLFAWDASKQWLLPS